MFTVKAEVIHRFWHVDFQKFVREEYDWPGYEVADEYDYPHNGSYFEFTVDGSSELEDIDDAAIVDCWIQTGETEGIEIGEDWEGRVQVRHILHRLFNEGRIPAGNYMLECYW